MVLIVPLAQ
jgi:two-component system, cell cycle response regulator DivK